MIGAGGSIDDDGKVTKASSSKVKRALTSEEKEKLGSLAALLDEENGSSEGDGDLNLWSPTFNSTFFPEGTNLSEKQKSMVIKAMMGDFHGENVDHN